MSKLKSQALDFEKNILREIRVFTSIRCIMKTPGVSGVTEMELGAKSDPSQQRIFKNYSKTTLVEKFLFFGRQTYLFQPRLEESSSICPTSQFNDPGKPVKVEHGKEAPSPESSRIRIWTYYCLPFL